MTDYERELLRRASTETNDLSEEGFLKECARLINAAFAPRLVYKPPPNPIPVLEGCKLRALRKAAGMTQLELAQNLGLKSSCLISLWEHNKQELPTEKLPLLADVLHCTIDELFGRDTGADST